MNLKALRAFALVVERGSLQKAAEVIHLSQPAVSRLISGLEAELDLTLFDRSGRNLQPTPEGLRFHAEVRRVLYALDGLRASASDAKDGAAPNLRVVALSRVAYTVVAEAAAKLLAAEPRIRLAVEVHRRRDIERWTAGQHFDLGFGPLPVAYRDVETEAVAALRAVAVLPPDDPLAGRRRVSIHDLAARPFVGMAPARCSPSRRTRRSSRPA